jgi:hypothetical protein
VGEGRRQVVTLTTFSSEGFKGAIRRPSIFGGIGLVSNFSLSIGNNLPLCVKGIPPLSSHAVWSVPHRSSSDWSPVGPLTGLPRVGVRLERN